MWSGGWLRDKETISLALTAAETVIWCLVLCTQVLQPDLHRIIDVFPGSDRRWCDPSVWVIAGGSAQKLLKRIERACRRHEIMMATPAFATLFVKIKWLRCSLWFRRAQHRNADHEPTPNSWLLRGWLMHKVTKDWSWKPDVLIRWNENMDIDVFLEQMMIRSLLIFTSQLMLDPLPCWWSAQISWRKLSCCGEFTAWRDDG